MLSEKKMSEGKSLSPPGLSVGQVVTQMATARFSSSLGVLFGIELSMLTVMAAPSLDLCVFPRLHWGHASLQ